MSDRSKLREAAMIRASHRCEFPPQWVGGKWVPCNMPQPLEMAHLKGSGMGGSQHRDVLNNVIMLCRYHHDWLDGRHLANGRRLENEIVLRAWKDRPWNERQ